MFNGRVGFGFKSRPFAGYNLTGVCRYAPENPALFARKLPSGGALCFGKFRRKCNLFGGKL